MVPVPVPGSWHEEQVDELFASLLGKGFENGDMENDLEHNLGEAPRGGFRVFR
jgi:protein AATF/BFR2